MTSITFYFNAGDRVEVACRLAAKAMQQGKRVLVYAPAPEVAQRFEPEAALAAELAPRQARWARLYPALRDQF